MSADVTKHVNACPFCCQARLKKQKRTRHLKLFPPSDPLEQVAIDILGPLPKTKRGHQYILVVTDWYSKLARAAPLRGVTAHEIAATFVDLWVASYGIPVFELCDNGSQFNSKLFQRVAQIMGLTQLFSSAYHPSMNGEVERFNSTILDKLRRYVDEEQNDWDAFGSPITFAYNSQIH
jgi:hypothetical protein